MAAESEFLRLALADPRGEWLVFRGSDVLVRDSDGLPPPPGGWIHALALVRAVPAGSGTGVGTVAIEVDRGAVAPHGCEFRGLKGLLDSLPPALVKRAARALELLEFDRAHRFCGNCGAPTVRKPGVAARVCSAPACAREHYPRISPVVIVLVERGEEVLLGRSPHFPPGLYSALAGFVDPGESAEEAAHREVFEETRVRIGALRYFASQPWPFPHALMLGYQAEYLDGEVCRAPDEIEDARFFHVDALPAVLPMRYTMASLLLSDFCRRHGRSLPG